LSVADGVGIDGVDGATDGVAAGVYVAGACIAADVAAVGEVVAEAAGIAATFGVAAAVGDEEAAGVEEARTVVVEVAVALLDGVAAPGVAGGIGNTALALTDGVANGLAASCGAVGVAIGLDCVPRGSAAAAVASGEGTTVGSGSKLSNCSLAPSGCDTSSCARASSIGHASIESKSPISNAREAQARVGQTIVPTPTQHSLRSRLLRAG